MLKEVVSYLNTFYNRRSPSNPKSQEDLISMPMTQNKNNFNRFEDNIIENNNDYPQENNINNNNYISLDQKYYPNNKGKIINKRPKSTGKITKNIPYNIMLNNSSPKYILIPNSLDINSSCKRNETAHFCSDNNNINYSQNNPLNFSANNIKRKAYSCLLNNKMNKSNDFLRNNSMNNFEKALNIIHVNGFQKYETEIENKKIKLAELQNSIALLNKKINICNKNLYHGLQKETKNKIKYDNLLTVSKRYKNTGNEAQKLRKEIKKFQEQIFELNNKTSWLRETCLYEENNTGYLEEETRYLNKRISDLKKDNEQFLPAIKLLRKHINVLRKKLEYTNNDKNNVMTSINRFAKNV